MGHEAKPETLIRYFKRQLPLIHGNFGTMIPGPAIYFKMHGFDVKMVLCRKKFDAVASMKEVSILFYFWRNKWKFGAHFTTVQYQDGKFVGYNTYNNSEGPDVYGESVDEFLKKQKYFGAVLFGISNTK